MNKITKANSPCHVSFHKLLLQVRVHCLNWTMIVLVKPSFQLCICSSGIPPCYVPLPSLSPVTCPCHDLKQFVVNKFNVVITIKLMMPKIDSPLIHHWNSVKQWGNCVIFNWQMPGFNWKYFKEWKIILRKNPQYLLLTTFLIIVEILEL